MKRYANSASKKRPPGRSRLLVPRRSNPAELVILANPHRRGRLAKKGKRNPAEMVILGNPKKRNPSREYDAALERFRVKAAKHRQARDNYLGGKMDESEYFRSRRDFDLAQRDMDRAEEKEKRRGNPATREVSEESVELYTRFHGKPPSEVIEVQQSSLIRNEYVPLGWLIEIILRAPSGKVQLDFSNDGIRLASNPPDEEGNGTQLYAIGGDQDISGSLGVFGSDASKDFVELGEARYIVYRGRKIQDGGSVNDYQHKFGDVGSEAQWRYDFKASDHPIVFFDRLKRGIFFVGGTYVIKDVGIVS